MPHWRALGHLDWNRGAWNASYSLQYVGGYRDCSTFEDGRFYCNNVRFAVTNLLNTNPPSVNFGTNANTDAATCRLMGLTYFLGLRYHTR